MAACQFAGHLSYVPYANRLVLAPPSEEGDETADATALLGRVGTTTSDLRPGGKADFGDRPIDVVAEWDFIGTGERVQVVEVEGTRVIVRSVRTV